MQHKNDRGFYFVLLCILLIIAFLADLFSGSAAVPVREIVNIILGRIPAREAWTTIILDYRLPKCLAAAAAGAALAVSGLLMQTLFRNPLAGPFVLGISSGASLGVAVLVLGLGSFFTGSLQLMGDLTYAAAGSVGSALVLAAVLLISRRIGSNVTLLIIGLMTGYAAGAVVSILSYFSSAEQIQTFVFWNFGSFANLTWGRLAIFLPIVFAGLMLSFLAAKTLNELLLGEKYAQSLGLNVKRARTVIITAASLLAGAVTSFCGPVAFLGLAVPHLCRRIFRSADHRLLVWACLVCGALLALVSDIISGLPGSSRSLPLNAVTAIIGAPLVIWIILKRRVES